MGMVDEIPGFSLVFSGFFCGVPVMMSWARGDGRKLSGR
jgi:hypothetical protein